MNNPHHTLLMLIAGATQKELAVAASPSAGQ
jgi:hypothetical protein